MSIVTQNLIDIILPIYNPNQKIYAAIDSVLAQTYIHWHLYIIDDASEDNIIKKLRNIYAYYSDKITYSQFEENKRAAACRNYAIKQGSGEYIAFIDQDDVWVSNKLKCQIEFLESSGYDAVHGNVQYIDTTDNIIKQEKWESDNESRREVDWCNLSKTKLSNKILRKPNIRIISSVVTRTIFESIGGFKDQFFGGEDELFWYEIARSGKIGYINNILFFRRVHENNTMNLYQTQRLYGYLKTLDYINKTYKNVRKDIIDNKRKEKLYALFKQGIIRKHFYYVIYSFSLLILKFPHFFYKKIKLTMILNKNYNSY